MHNIIISRFGARIGRLRPNRRVLLWLCKTKLVRVVGFLWWQQSDTSHASNGSTSMILETWLQVARLQIEEGVYVRGEGSRRDSLKNQCSEVVKIDKDWPIKPPSMSLLAEDSYLPKKGKILIWDPDEDRGRDISQKRQTSNSLWESEYRVSKLQARSPPTTAATWTMDGVAKFGIFLTKLNSATTVQNKNKNKIKNKRRRRFLRSITSTCLLYEFVNNN
jgi:hypothetical protein